MPEPDHTVFMFTIATNGYDQIFADCLESQEAYAARHGYRYLAVRQSPPWGINGANSAWLKIPLMLHALRRGYSWVCFVDADCTVRPHAPALESVKQQDKTIYVGLDFSNRINSGVIIAQNAPVTVRFFQRLYLIADVPGVLLPKADRNLYENGHFIYLAKQHPAVALFDTKWNNTTGKPIGEYIWHGGGRYHQKPRASAPPKGTFHAVLKRLREGPRILLLRRLVRLYAELYDI